MSKRMCPGCRSPNNAHVDRPDLYDCYLSKPAEPRPAEPEALSEEELEWLKSSHFQTVRDMVAEVCRLRARERELEAEVKQADDATREMQMVLRVTTESLKASTERVASLEGSMETLTYCTDAAAVARAALEKP